MNPSDSGPMVGIPNVSLPLARNFLELSKNSLSPRSGVLAM